MTREVIDSVIESQAVALSAKNEEIRKLEGRLKVAEGQIDSLKHKVDAGLYQNMMDQIMEDAVAALDDGLTGREMDFGSEIGIEGDTINIFDSRGNVSRLVLRRVEVSQDVVVSSTGISRDFRWCIESVIRDLVRKISALDAKKLAFRRLPSPIGMGMLCASSNNKYGVRVVMTYNVNSLSNCLRMEVLCGEGPR